MASSKTGVRSAVLLLACSLPLAAQVPLFAEVGDPLPNGMGQAIGAADFEGDGDVDLFTTAGVFLNQLGFFRPGPVLPSTFVVTTNVRSIAIADFTADGRVDVLVGRLGGSPAGLVLYAAPPVGGASFVAPAGPIGGAAAFEELGAADVDNDGDVDVLAAGSYAPGWTLLVNGGSGAFAVAPPAQWPATAVNPTWIGTGDFDNDGWVDAFGTAPSGAVWRRNLGGGAFGPTQALASTLVADAGAVGDFDNDGDDDVFVADVYGNEAIHQGAAAGLTSGATAFGGILGPPPVAADLDGDGAADLVRTVVSVSGSAEGALQVRLGSPGGLGLPIGLGQVALGAGNPMPFAGVTAADFDGDLDRDLAVVGGALAPMLLINGGAAGPAIAPQSVPPGFGRLYAPPRDIDGDGDVDLLTGAANGAIFLAALANDGRGAFPGPVVPAGVQPGFFGRTAWGDLDRDGDPDLFVVGFAQSTASVAMLNNGAGVFAPGGCRTPARRPPSPSATSPVMAIPTCSSAGAPQSASRRCSSHRS